MTKISLDFTSTVIKTSVGKDSPDSVEFDFAKFTPEVLRAALINGFLGALNNIPKSNGKDEAPKSNAEWLKAKQDKIAVWANGSWSTGRTGDRDSLAGEMRDAFQAEQEAKGVSRKESAKTIASTVKEAFGDKESATFANFLLAVATNLAKANLPEGSADEVTAKTKELADKLEAKYRTMALANIASRKEAGAKIDLTGLLD